MYNRKSIHTDSKDKRIVGYTDYFLDWYTVWEVNGQPFYRDTKGKIRKITTEFMTKKAKEIEDYLDE